MAKGKTIGLAYSAMGLIYAKYEGKTLYCGFIIS